MFHTIQIFSELQCLFDDLVEFLELQSLQVFLYPIYLMKWTGDSDKKPKSKKKKKKKHLARYHLYCILLKTSKDGLNH